MLSRRFNPSEFLVNTDVNIDRKNKLYVALSSSFPKLTEARVNLCISSALIMVIIVSITNFKNRNTANQTPNLSSQYPTTPNSSMN